MRTLRRILFIASILTALLCVVLLLNFTAPNPTGRRYSSETPLTTGQGSGQQIGLSAEMILSRDLRLPRNDAADQLQCICGTAQTSPIPQECRACVVHIPLSGRFRRPDFISPHFLAESKNTRDLLYTHTDRVDQISDYAGAAIALGRPLWLYTRVNTDLSPEFYQIVEATGGGVVHYFATPGYVDPIDRLAQIGLVVAAGAFLIALLPKPALPRRVPKPRVPVTARASDKVATAEQFVRQTKDRARLDRDIEDSRHDPRS